MKPLIYITIIVLLITGSLAGYFFFMKEPQSHIYTVMIDETGDTLNHQRLLEDLLSVVDFENDKWDRIEVRVGSISDIDYTPNYIAVLPAQNMLLGNPDQRLVAVQNFKQEVIANAGLLQKESGRRPRSKVYSPVIRMLNELATSPAQSKIIYLYSDCLENSTMFSIYNKRDQQLIIQNPNSIKQLFLRNEKPKYFGDIEVHIIYTSKNEFTNDRFVLMSGLFKSILEEAHAKVFIEANLPIAKKNDL